MARTLGPLRPLAKRPRRGHVMTGRNSAITEARTPRGFGTRLWPTSSRAYGRPFPRDRWKCRPGRACAPTFLFEYSLSRSLIEITVFNRFINEPRLMI